MIDDLGRALKGQRVAPFDVYRRAVISLHLVGREGLSLIAVSGLDMAAWDALAQGANMQCNGSLKLKRFHAEALPLRAQG